MHWQDSPPVHVSVAALLRSWSGKATDRPVAGRSAAGVDNAHTTSTASAMEGVAAVLGPPVHRFRPPCRMQPPST